MSAPSPTVLITSTSFGKKIKQPLEILRSKGYTIKLNDVGRPLNPPELIERLADCEGCIAGLDYFTAEVFRACPTLRIVSRYGVGLDRVDLQAAAEAGVVVTNTPEANSDSVADLALTLMLAVARKIPAADRSVRSGQWQNIYGVSLAGKTVGVIGMGRIGRRVVARARGFGCRALVYDPLVDAQRIREAGGEPAPLTDVLGQSDFLSLHLPATEQTRGFLGREQFQAMKAGAILVNTARGELVDQDALLEALRSGRLYGAGLDAHAKEPPDPTVFEGMDTVVLTPHMGSYTEEALYRMGMDSVENLTAFFEGRQPPNKVGYALA